MEKDKAYWNDGLVDVFVDLFVKEVDNNNRPHTHFNKIGWENLINNFTIETGRKYNKPQLKNKWDSLKEQWKLWKSLKGKETGLGWDPKLQTIDASDEWWDNKIKGGKEYAKFRKKGIPPEFEAKLDRMFKGISASGEFAYAPSSSLPLPESPVQCDAEMDIEEGSGDFDEIGKLKTTSNKRKSREKGKGLVMKRENVGGATHLAKQIDRMVGAIESRSASASVVSNKTQDVTSIKEVMKIVSSLPGMVMGSELFFFATQLFIQPEKREMFCTMEEPDLKLNWLKFEKSTSER